MTEQVCLKMAGRIGPETRAFVKELLADKRVQRLPAARGVIRLGDKYDHDRVEAACKRAVAYGIGNYQGLERILKKGLEDQPELEGLAMRSKYLAFVPSARFGRNIGQMLSEVV